MALETKQFNELISFSRASGATRISSQGLIVGVDFSSTSNTISTGSKSFILASDLNVDRDWDVGNNVIAVSQAGATGTMTGVVTSYSPATQTLVVNVTSITGSGTSTDWRIGSLEKRVDFDPVTRAVRGMLVEGQASNLVNFSPYPNGLNNVSRVNNAIISPDGSLNASLFTSTPNLNSFVSYNPAPTTPVSGTTTYSFYAKYTGQGNGRLYLEGFQITANDYFDILNGSVVTPSGSQYFIENVGNGWYRCSARRAVNTNNTVIYLGVFGNQAAVASAYLWGFQLVDGNFFSSYIPTTTVAVTRAADITQIVGTNFSQAYGSANTLVMDITPSASTVQAVAASVNDGTVNNAVRIAQKQTGTTSSIRKMADDGTTTVMAVNASTGNTIRSNGIDYVEISDQSAVGKFGVASSGVNQFLNVGGTENFRNSTDGGLTYNARTIGGSFGGAHFGIGRFVIANNTSVINGATVGSVIVSTDGLSFRRVNIQGLTQQLNEITSNNTNQYVAVGQLGVIYTSPDAEIWTAQNSGSGSSFNAVHFFGGRYVAVSAGAANQHKYSDNGTTWTGLTGLAANMVDVYHNGTNLWVAVGIGGSIYSSADGITWTARTSNVTQTLNGVHFADGLWVAVGAAGTVVTSPDGITWTDRTATSGTGQTLSEVNFFGGKFYWANASAGQVGENTAANIVANTTWTLRSTATSGGLNGIATSPTTILVCGTNSGIGASTDGITFTNRNGNAIQLNGAAFGNGTYVVVGNAVNGSGVIATVDPVTFAYQRRVSGVTGSIADISFGAGKFVAVGHSATTALSSSDGITWVDSTIAGLTITPVAVAFGNGTFIIIGTGNNGRSALSADGITWTNNSPTGSNQIRGVAAANGLFVAVGLAGTIITSPNGTTWTLRTSGTTNALFSVMYSARDGQWYAAGDNGTILRSPDAITWENISNDAISSVMTNGVIQANPFLPNLNVGVRNRVAMRIQSNAVATSVNGAATVNDTSVSLPSVNRITIGMNGVQGMAFNGYINRITLYPNAKTDAELQQLSI